MDEKPKRHGKRGGTFFRRFSRDRGSFGRKAGKFDNYRNIAVVSLIVLLVVGAVFALSTLGIGRSARRNTAEVIVESGSFDPIKDYSAVRDAGTIDQLETLLIELRDRNMEGKITAVRFDNADRIVEIADLVLSHPDRDEQQRSVAAKAKINALWNFYLLDMVSGGDDPDVPARLFAATDGYLDDNDRSVSRDAHQARTMGLVGEAARGKPDGDLKEVELAITDLLEKFPDDPEVIQSMRTMFFRMRATNNQFAEALLTTMMPILNRLKTEPIRELALFIQDIDLLYDAGIGSEPSIESIKVDDVDFLQRIERLNDSLDSGEAVVAQLDNAVEYLERNRKFELALELSRRIFDNADRRTHPAAAARAKMAGENGIARNSLLNQSWSFEGVDKQGNAIDVQRFANQVTVIVFLSASDPRSAAAFNTLRKLGDALTGREVQWVLVEVGSGKTGPEINSKSVDRWTTMKTSTENPDGYLLQCPTNRFPYVVLVNKQGNVEAINVALSDLKTAVEHLLSKQ